MPIQKVNGVNLFYELIGENKNPLVFVHGSWGDHHNWDLIASSLAQHFRVLTYDRRGHSQSEQLTKQGFVVEDVEDLIQLVASLQLLPANFVGNSFGSIIVLKTAIKRPDIIKSIFIHEPPLFSLIQDNPKAKPILDVVQPTIRKVMDLIAHGEMRNAATLFVNQIALGAGEWEKLPPTTQQTFINNAYTWYDELQDPDSLTLNIDKLADFDKPVLLSTGSESPSIFPMVMDCIENVVPKAKRIALQGAGHVPHLSHPQEYVQLIRQFCSAAEK